MRKKLTLLMLVVFIVFVFFVFLFFFSSKSSPKDETNPKESTPPDSSNNTQAATSAVKPAQDLKNVNSEENYPLLVKLRVPYGDSRFAISWREDLQAPWGVVILALPKGKTSTRQAIEYTKAYITSRGVPPETIKIEAGIWKE